MSLKIDRVELEIVIKNDENRKQLRQLEDSMRNLRKEMKKLPEGQDAWLKKKAELEQMQSKYDAIYDKIGLTGLSLKELRKRQQDLNAVIRQLPGDSPLLTKYRKQLTEVNARIGELNGKAKQTGISLSKMAEGVNKYFGMITVAIAGITGLSMAFRKMAEDYAHMDDVASDVRKTTNLTNEEVQALNEEFKKMDTRTTRESLNNLARDAGKLGIEGSQNILDFVEAGNMINVALGEDLGEDAIKNIGKMVGVFDKSTKELQGIGLKEQMLAVGSAINTLGASSSADEGYLVSFAGRLGGIAKQANISMDSILGFGSALDQDMQQVEMSATALQNFIMKLMADPAKFAKLAGLEVKGFTKLLNTDANAAIKQVLRAMNEKGGFQSLIPMFQDMGLDGARAVGVLSSMAGSIDKIDEAQRVANKAMAEGTSVVKEYEIKNSNLAAQLDKAKKSFTETSLALGASLNPILLKSTHLITYLTKGLVLLIPHLPTIGKWMLVLTGYFIAYNSQQLLNNLLMKEGLGLKLKDLVLKAKDAIAMETLSYRTAIQTALVGKTTVATKAAAAAQAIWNTALKANPLGMFIGILTTVTALFWIFTKRANEMNELQRAQQNISKRVSEAYDDQSARLSSLTSILNNNNIEIGKRKQALKDIQSIVPNYHASLTNEGTLINNNTDAIKEYLVQLEKQTRFEASRDELTRLYKQKQQQEKTVSTTKSAYDASKNQQTSGGAMTGGAFQEGEKLAKKAAYTSSVSNLSETNAAISALQKDIASEDNAFVLYVPVKIKEGSTKVDADGKTYVYKSGKWVLRKDQAITPAGGDDDPNKKAVAALDDQLLARQVALKKEGKSKEAFDESMLDLEVEFLTKKRNLYTKDSAKYNEYENRLQDIQQAKTTTANEAALKSIQDAHSANLRAIDVYENEKREMLQDGLDNGTKTQEQFNRESLELDKVLAEKRLQEAKDYAELIRGAKFNTKEDQDKAVTAATDAVNAESAALTKAEKAITKNRLQGEKEHLENVAKLREELGLNKEKLSYQEGLKALRKKLKDAEASERESANAIQAYKLQKIEEYAQESVRFTSTVADFVNASNDAQASRLEAAKQRELTAAGNNADERERIEKEYAQKELDLKKKQADANMSIAIAQALAQGALGIAQIWAVNGINPVYAGILTALLVGITGAQISSAVEQRNAIKSTSLGYRGGGFTNDDPDDDKEVGVVHANEFVTNAKGVRNPNVRKFLDVFDMAQKRGTIHLLNTSQILEQTKLTAGSRRSGGYGSDGIPVVGFDSGSGNSNQMAEFFRRNADVQERLIARLNKPIRAHAVISGDDGVYNQMNKFKSIIKNASR